jgi:hypothetical protein
MARRRWRRPLGAGKLIHGRTISGNARVRSKETPSAPTLQQGRKNMKIDRMNFGRLLPVVAAGMLAYAGTAYAQTEKQPPTEKQIINKPAEPRIALHRVTDKSAAVNLTAVAKEESPGMVEVDPNAIAGKRLVIPSGGKTRHICLGKWIALKAGPTCEGTWVEW